jgi:hypothetical protein
MSNFVEGESYGIPDTSVFPDINAPQNMEDAQKRRRRMLARAMIAASQERTPDPQYAPGWTSALTGAHMSPRSVEASALPAVAKLGTGYVAGQVAADEADQTDAEYKRLAAGNMSTGDMLRSDDPMIRAAALRRMIDEPERAAAAATQAEKDRKDSAKVAQDTYDEIGKSMTEFEKGIEATKDRIAKEKLAQSVRDEAKADRWAMHDDTIANKQPPDPYGQMVVTDQGTFIRNKRTNQLEPVGYSGSPSVPAQKPLTESQATSTGYLGRMQAAEKLLDTMPEGHATFGTEIAGSVPSVGDTLRRVVSSDSQQNYRQAQEDWVRAKLRKESGAAIPPAEMDREIATYFPMPGDREPVIKQKAASRKQAQQQMQVGTGRAPQADVIKNGYRLKPGANPKLKSSWEKL